MCGCFSRTFRAIDKGKIKEDCGQDIIEIPGGEKYGKPEVFQAFAGMHWNSRRAVLSTANHGGQ